MNRNYLVLIIITIGLAIGILIMDREKQVKQIDPTALAIAYNEPSRFLSIDNVTHSLITDDPSLILIDVRPAEQYKMFAIPGAINIPVDSLLTPSSVALFKVKDLNKVLYSNADLWSDQAWLLLKRLDMPNVFVLDGGVNKWFAEIVQAVEPLPTAPQEEFDLYSLHVAANQHFYGKNVADQIIEKPVQKVSKPAPIIRQAPEESTGGGC
jgi:3-mercaptopyruvate sulfurtransferase SseA